MKYNFKKNIVLFMMLTLIICAAVPAYAATATEAETKAEALKELSLFKGVSENDFSLDRAPTRVEVMVMLIRAMGKETEALHVGGKHPFTDVPAWANQYIGYAYEKNLTKGVSTTSFGTGNADSDMYLTFMLRALGYNDSQKDFMWNAPNALAKAVGILPEGVNTETFLRSDVVLISWAALEADLKHGNQCLAKKLIADGVFTGDTYEKAIQLVGEPKPVATQISTLAELKEALVDQSVKNIAVASNGTPFLVTDELTIPKGVTITISRGSDFYIEATLTNNGIIEIKGADSFTDNFINYSVMAVQKGGKVINNGELVLCQSEIGDTVDRGPVGGQLRIFDGIFENKGSVFLKAGKINTHGGMIAVIDGIFSNDTVVIMDGFQIDIVGSFVNNKGAVIINNSYISTQKGGSFTNNGVLTGEMVVE